MQNLLLEIFSERPKRFKLLDAGLRDAGITEKSNLLEIGCAYGDAAAHITQTFGCRTIGIDISSELVQKALMRHENLTKNSAVQFMVKDAQKMDFPAEEFHFMLSEAAFSPMPQKDDAVREYHRVLKKGGRIVLNDFAIKNEVSNCLREEMDFIPCFAGVKTPDTYINLFEKQGFQTMICKEVYAEMIAISVWLSKSLGVPIKNIGQYFVSYLSGNTENLCINSGNQGAFFKESRLSYYQIIFQK